MIVHDSWWSKGRARSTIIDYHAPFDQGSSHKKRKKPGWKRNEDPVSRGAICSWDEAKPYVC